MFIFNILDLIFLIENLYFRLKIETLNKCEDVISKLYIKVVSTVIVNDAIYLIHL